jgi:hypothetical protein
MPQLWADLQCARNELSDRFWQATASCRKEFTELGFTEIGFKKNKGSLSPHLCDTGGINYLDNGRHHYAQLFYVRVFNPGRATAETEELTIAFTCSFQHTELIYANKQGLFDSLPRQEIIRLPGMGVSTIYGKLKEDLARRNETPRLFPDDDSLTQWFDSNQRELFEYRVRTGLFVKMTDGEVEAARRKLPPPLPEAR